MVVVATLALLLSGNENIERNETQVEEMTVLRSLLTRP